MSCSACCLPGAKQGLKRNKQLLVKSEEEEEEEEVLSNMDISLLREQYRSTRETQRRHTHVLLYRTVSEELSDSVVPVAMGLASPREQISCLTPDPVDPWHIHLDTHRHTHTRTQESRGSSFSSEVVSFKQEVTSSTETSPRSSTTEEEPDKMDATHTSSLDHSEQKAGDEISTSDQQAHGDDTSQSAPRKSIHDVIQHMNQGTLCTATSTPRKRLDRRMSLGGLGGLSSSTATWGNNQNQTHSYNYQPFPNRKAHRISEAARKLGMYSSF